MKFLFNELKSEKVKKLLIFNIVSGALFLLFTGLVLFVNVKEYAPTGAEIGFYNLNVFFFNLIGVSENFDKLTDLTMLFSLGVVGAFVVWGAVQLFKRKSLLKVDKDIYYFALTLIILAIIYVVFEKLIVNYRPILVDGKLEASYPSSTTMLVHNWQTITSKQKQ
jgi:undecaprenyl-diphosphatase